MNKKYEFKKAIFAAFPNTIPVLTGFLVLGTAYGVLMQTKGYGIVWSVMMSMIAFCGSMQFVAITLLTTAFNPMQAFLLSLMVNARHIFYGISMLNKYKGMGKVKPFLIFFLCDETFSICSSVEPESDINKKYFYTAISVFNYIYWICGTFIGGTLGHFISFNTNGLDFVLTALFIVLFIEQLKTRQSIIAGCIGIICTSGSLILFGASNLVLPAMALILLILLIWRKKICI